MSTAVNPSTSSSLIKSLTKGAAASTPSASSSGLNLKPADFISMMITQLKNQDPMQPTSNEQLLQQMSQIGQLESSDQMQTTLQTVTLQNTIGAAGNLIGKTIQGLDANGAPQTGVVNSVQVKSNSVYLQLDSGVSLSMSNVTAVSATPTATTAAATPASSAAGPTLAKNG